MLGALSFGVGVLLLALALRAPQGVLRRLPLPGGLSLGVRSLRTLLGAAGLLLAYVPVRGAADGFFNSALGQGAFVGFTVLLLALAWTQRRGGG